MHTVTAISYQMDISPHGQLATCPVHTVIAMLAMSPVSIKRYLKHLLTFKTAKFANVVSSSDNGSHLNMMPSKMVATKLQP